MEGNPQWMSDTTSLTPPQHPLPQTTEMAETPSSFCSNNVTALHAVR